jgi:hypothetical protein
MLYGYAWQIDAWHKPTETWHVAKGAQNVRAVSRKHAIDKALRNTVRLPANRDRAGHADWTVTAEVTLLPASI